MERRGCLAALPGFLAESEMAGGAFSSKARLETTPARDRQRRYLASHRYEVEPGRELHEPPGGALRLVLEAEIGRAHVCTPVPNANLVCCLRLEKKNNI